MAANVSADAATRASGVGRESAPEEPDREGHEGDDERRLEAEPLRDERRDDAEDGVAERRQHAEQPDRRPE